MSINKSFANYDSACKFALSLNEIAYICVTLNSIDYQEFKVVTKKPLNYVAHTTEDKKIKKVKDLALKYSFELNTKFDKSRENKSKFEPYLKPKQIKEFWKK